jgi:uncharacterized protein (TIGR02246 family)
MHDDEAAIRRVIATWLQASASGDTGTVLGLMAEDVVFLRPGNEPMRGRSAFAAAQSSMGKFKIAADSDIQEIKVMGEWAYCWNKLTVTISPEDGGSAVIQSGNVLSIFRKSEGAWQLFRDANMLTKAPQ